MPVKSHSEESSSNGASNVGDKKLNKREIKMPDGRYMIFYTENLKQQAESEKKK